MYFWTAGDSWGTFWKEHFARGALTDTHTHTPIHTHGEAASLLPGANSARRLAPTAYCLATANQKSWAGKLVGQLDEWKEKVLRIWVGRERESRREGKGRVRVLVVMGFFCLTWWLDNYGEAVRFVLYDLMVANEVHHSEISLGRLAIRNKLGMFNANFSTSTDMDKHFWYIV